MRLDSVNLPAQNRIFKLAVEQGLNVVQISQRLNLTQGCVAKFMPVEHPVTGEPMHARDFARFKQKNGTPDPVLVSSDDEDDGDDD